MIHKIGIDARELEKPAYGVARYVRNVISTLVTGLNDFEIYLFFKDRIPTDDYLKNDKIKTKLLKIPGCINRDIVWQQIYLPYHIKKNNIDLFFSGQYTIPYNISAPTICTVHDLSYFVNHKWFPKREGFLLRSTSKVCLKKVTKIIASSNNTAKDIKKYLPIADEKITTIYPGLSEDFFAKPNMKDISFLKKHKVSGKYILWVGSILNRRNIALLLSAFEDLASKLKEINLVVIGEERCIPSINLQRLIDKHKYPDRIHHFKYIDEDELLSFYDNASLFVFLSEYEGFGYTPLEAASRGIPVILYDNPTFREIFGDYAQYVDNKSSLVQTINNSLNDKKILKKVEEFKKVIEEKYRAKVNNQVVLSIIKKILTG